MTTSDEITNRMIQKAAKLVNGTQNEEAWHLIGLFQQTQPHTFLQICHHLLASFLDLTYDYFDNPSWPLRSRLVCKSTQVKKNSRSRLIQEVFEMPSTSYAAWMSPARNPCGINSFKLNATDGNSAVTSKKFTSRAGKLLFKQLLPSRTLMSNSAIKSDIGVATPGEPERSQLKSTNAFKWKMEKQLVDSKLSLSSKPETPTAFGFNRHDHELAFPFVDRGCNWETTLCGVLISYMLSDPKVYCTEGIFRIPGNNVRIRELCFKLIDYLQTPYYRIPQPDPDQSQSSLSPQPCHNFCELHQILKCYSAHDIASLLLRCLSTCASDASQLDNLKTDIWDCADAVRSNSFNCESNVNKGGIVPIQAGNLLFQATALEYDLELSNKKENQEDWVHILCRSRQLFAYRIVLQLLIPPPERCLLLHALRLFKMVHDHSDQTKMSAECLARCTAFAIFGAPATNMQKLWENPDSRWNPLKWRIDTVNNLIALVSDLEDLPGLVYTAVRDRLRNHLGNSPIPRQTIPRPYSEISNNMLELMEIRPIHTEKKTENRTMRNFLKSSSSSSICLTKSFLQSNMIRTKSNFDINAKRRSKKSAVQHTPVTKSYGTLVDPFVFWKRQKNSSVDTNVYSTLKSSRYLMKARSSTQLKHLNKTDHVVVSNSNALVR